MKNISEGKQGIRCGVAFDVVSELSHKDGFGTSLLKYWNSVGTLLVLVQYWEGLGTVLGRS